MAKVRASLPEPSGVGFVVMVLAICVLIVVNSIATATVYFVLESRGMRWLDNPRTGQPVLFLAPLALLVVELWVGSILGRYLGRLRRSNGD